MANVSVGIIGGTGYTGVELLRLLSSHPHVVVKCITSRSEAGKAVTEIYPSLSGACDLVFEDPEAADLHACDVIFSAAPNGVAMQHAPGLLNAGCRVVDLSADFRLRDVAVWEKWYGMTHACPDLLGDSVYGLPELHREQIRSARLLANPGCYPTAVQLGFLPLLENGLVETESLIADAKSGVSGAGRSASVGILFSEVSDSFKAYGVPGHRHLPEIRQGLEDICGGNVELVFTPHLLPMIRGIHATLYARLNSAGAELSVDELTDLYTSRYQDEPFVDIMPPESHPDTRSVRGSNHCRIAVHRPQGGRTVTVLAVEDNLVKGAAGQAVQNANLMLGLEETAGLPLAGWTP